MALCRFLKIIYPDFTTNFPVTALSAKLNNVYTTKCSDLTECKILLKTYTVISIYLSFIGKRFSFTILTKSFCTPHSSILMAKKSFFEQHQHGYLLLKNLCALYCNRSNSPLSVLTCLLYTSRCV